MSDRIKESDWKVLRELHPVALDRFSRQILDEVTAIVGDSHRSHHQRYIAVCRLIERRTRDVEETFNDMRRSRAIHRILYIRELGLFAEDEFARFSEETRRTINAILDIDKQ